MIGRIDIAVEEIYVNIASYSYDEECLSKPVWVECGEADGDFLLVFKDSGKRYNPLDKETPVIGDYRNMTIGSYGIYMVKMIADEVTYEYEEEKRLNVLMIR